MRGPGRIQGSMHRSDEVFLVASVLPRDVLLGFRTGALKHRTGDRHSCAVGLMPWCVCMYRADGR